MTHYYSSTAVDTTLSIGIGAADTSMTVASTTGFPTSYPYTLAIGYDTSSEELVDVTYASGTVLTITRAVDSTTGQSHAAASTVKHVICGRDLRDSQTHIDATTSVHGIADTSLLTTASNTQTFTNKTLTSPVINSASLFGTITTTGTLTFGTNSSAITANGATLSATELSYLDGVTSAIQTQINAKAPTQDPTFTGTVTLPSGTTLTAAVLTAPAINGATINAASTIGGISGTTIAADHATWTSSNPTISSGWTGTAALRYIQIGKTVHFHFTYSVAAGGSSATDMTVTLPVTVNSANSIRWTSGGEFLNNAGTRYLASAPITTSGGVSTFVVYVPSASTPNVLVKLTPTVPSTSTGGDSVSISGTYEAA